MYLEVELFGDRVDGGGLAGAVRSGEQDGVCVELASAVVDGAALAVAGELALAAALVAGVVAVPVVAREHRLPAREPLLEALELRMIAHDFVLVLELILLCPELLLRRRRRRTRWLCGCLFGRANDRVDAAPLARAWRLGWHFECGGGGGGGGRLVLAIVLAEIARDLVRQLVPFAPSALARGRVEASERGTLVGLELKVERRGAHVHAARIERLAPGRLQLDARHRAQVANAHAQRVAQELGVVLCSPHNCLLLVNNAQKKSKTNENSHPHLNTDERARVG